MARPLSVQFDGALYHVTSRGNARDDIVEDDTDRHAFLDCVGKVVDRFHWLCHGGDVELGSRLAIQHGGQVNPCTSPAYSAYCIENDRRRCSG